MFVRKFKKKFSAKKSVGFEAAPLFPPPSPSNHFLMLRVCVATTTLLIKLPMNYNNNFRYIDKGEN